MLTEQRYEIILGLLREKNSVTVTELKDILEASESTVRRDITALYKAGKLTRVFGGAVALEQKVNAYEPTVAQKSELNTEEKKEDRSLCSVADKAGGFCVSGCRNYYRIYAGASE